VKFVFGMNVACITDDEGTIVSSAEPAKLADTFFSGGSIELGTLPPAVRWISNDGLGIIIERPPSYVDIYCEYDEVTYQIPLPWSVYGFRLDNSLKVEQAYFFVRPFTISQMTDEIYTYPIPGIGDQSKINLPDPDPHTKIGVQILPMISDHWKNFKASTHMNTENIPREWLPHWDNENLNKYLTHLQSLSLSDVLFTDYQTSSITTISSLTEILDESLPEFNTVIEFFDNLIKRSQ